MNKNNQPEYQPIGEPSKLEKSKNWDIAIGLQEVDGLHPSQYLRQIAKEHTDGKITIGEVYEHIDSYYKNAKDNNLNNGTEEADKVSVRITEILADPSFTFLPPTYIAIHKRLFFDIHPKIAGKIRRPNFLPEFPDGNIQKSEAILGGKSVGYSDSISIQQALEYDFAEEKKINYIGLDKRARMERMAKFISGIWQIHPFFEGNTRTTAVFAIKYLRQLGFSANNDLFKENSKYFRNALVLANYQNMADNISFSFEFLHKFFGNLLLGENNVLDNSEMYITSDINPKTSDKSEKSSDITSDKLSKAEKEFFNLIVGFLNDNEFIDSSKAQELTQKSTQRVRQLFNALVDTNILIPVGENKGRKYKLAYRQST